MAQRRPNTPSSIIYMFVAVWRARRLPFYVFPLCLNGHASGSHCVEMALVRCGWGASLRLDEDIKRPGSGVRAIRVSGGGWGARASHFSGSAYEAGAGNVGNRAGGGQGARRGWATHYLMYRDFRRSGLAGTLAVGLAMSLGEPDDDGERGRRKSNKAGGQGGHRSILGGAAPACEPYSPRVFPDDVLECFRTVSLRIVQRCNGASSRSNSASELILASAVAARFDGSFCRPGSSKPWVAPG